MRLRLLRFAVVSSLVLCASKVLGQEAPPSTTVESAQSVTPPRLIRAEPALVPDGEALSEPVSVTLALTIDETGHVSESAVVESGGERFDQSALNAVNAFEFEPARRAGNALSVKIHYRYVFPAQVPVPVPAPAPDTPSGSAPAGTASEVAKATTPSEPEQFSAVARVDAPPREVTRHSISGEMLRDMPGTRGDALRAIEVLPGVGRTSLNNGDPILRGAGQDESQTYLNGVPVPFLYHFGGLTSFFNSRFIERVDLYPGNFSTRYGRVSGGVLEVRSKDPRADGFHAGVDLNLVDSSAFVSSPLGKKASVGLSARRSNIDLVFSKLVPKDAYSVVAAPVYYDYQALGAFHIDAQNTLRIVGYGSRDSLELLFSHPNDEDPSLSGTIAGTLAFQRLQLELDSKLADSARQNLSVTLGHLAASQQFGALEQVISGTELHARSEWRVEFFPELSATFGADFYGQFLGGRYHGPAPDQYEGNPSDHDSILTRRTVSTVVPSFNVIRPGAYLELGLRPTRRLLLLPGLRADYYGDVDHASLDPRLSARYEASPGFTLKSGLGYYSQAPQYWQALPVVGNPRIEPYRALQASLGFEERAGDTLKLGVEGFYKWLENRIVGTPGGVPPHFVNDGEGRIYGAEFSFEYRPRPGSFAYLSYTLSRSERRDGDGPYRLFDHDEPHVLSLAASQSLGRGWTVGARFRLISGDPTTAVVASVFDARSGIYVPQYGPVNGERDPAFQQLDLRVEKQWRIATGALSVYLDVLNAYNAKNPQGYRYSFDFSKKEPIAGLGLFPNLGLKGEL
ncbi:MAG TPA: TonB-dependent receptor [Polyangiaceae bacterium]|nr:TonB-dependent receptor [Polyangiaceae bacterium]